MLKFLLITLLGVTLIIPKCDGNCIWYGVCYPEVEDIEDDGPTFNCKYNGPGYPIGEDREAHEIMQQICPDIYTNCKQEHKNWCIVQRQIHFHIIFL